MNRFLTVTASSIGISFFIFSEISLVEKSRTLRRDTNNTLPSSSAQAIFLISSASAESTPETDTARIEKYPLKNKKYKKPAAPMAPSEQYKINLIFFFLARLS